MKHEENHKDCQTESFRRWLEKLVGKSEPGQSSGFLVKNIFLNENGQCFVVLKNVLWSVCQYYFFFIWCTDATWEMSNFILYNSCDIAIVIKMHQFYL